MWKNSWKVAEILAKKCISPFNLTNFFGFEIFTESFPSKTCLGIPYQLSVFPDSGYCLRISKTSWLLIMKLWMRNLHLMKHFCFCFLKIEISSQNYFRNYIENKFSKVDKSSLDFFWKLIIIYSKILFVF